VLQSKAFKPAADVLQSKAFKPAPDESLFHCEKINQKRLAPGARRFGCYAAAAAARPTPLLRSVSSCFACALRFSPNAGRHQLAHPCLRSLRDPARFARYAFTAARSVKQWCLAPAFGCDARRA